jgi:predicted dithiol-disulfide oxidoreductase (DUF899 family)
MTRLGTREEWLQARLELLRKEKEHSRLRDELAAARRALPWVELTQEYTFEGDKGPVTMRDLFGSSRQLLVYHFMFDPEWDNGCKSCSFLTDHLQGALPHLPHRDAALVCISRAPYPKLAAFRERMGWSHRWVSSQGNSFNYDYGVSFTEADKEAGAPYNFGALKGWGEAPGLSVFVREGDRILHTYSTYSRGLDELIGAYTLLDLTPLGRNEDGKGMAWVRRKDEYEDG